MIAVNRLVRLLEGQGVGITDAPTYGWLDEPERTD